MADMTVAKTILEQLGGRQFILLTGSKNFLGDDNSLTFAIGRNDKAVTHCKITLDPSDTYTVTFMRIRKFQVTTISTHSDIYFDGLKDLFERETGLYVTLHPRH